MRRGGLGLVILLTTGCATTQARSPDLVKQACQEDVAADERCVTLLTEPQDGYEAKAEVRAAEDARQADAFQDRLARLRSAHEARLKSAIRTSSAAGTLGGPRLETASLSPADGPAEPDEHDALTRQLELAARDEGLDHGTSLRAITVAPKPVMPKVVLPALPKRTAPPSFGPTPAQWLRAGVCVTTADKASLSGLLSSLRDSRGASRAQMGSMALIVLDLQGLLDRLQAEAAHRRLAKPGPLCSSSMLSAAISHLRAQLGAPVARAQDVDRYVRGLTQLEKSLETRAGLPPAK